MNIIMDIVDVIMQLIIVLALLGLVAIIIYAPYFAIMHFIEKPLRQRFIKKTKRYIRRTSPNNTHLIIVFESIISMLTRIAKSDGVISELEADVIKDSITHFVSIARAEGLNTSQLLKLRKQLVQAHNKAKIVNTPIATYARQLVHYDFYMKEQVLQQLIFMASIDGYTKLKESLIFNAGEILGFHQTQIRRYINNILGVKQESPREDSNAYTTIGCKSSDDNTTIKKKYRELVKKYHPDFIQSKGQDESSVEFAKQKMQEINHAYNRIKRERGI